MSEVDRVGDDLCPFRGGADLTTGEDDVDDVDDEELDDELDDDDDEEEEDDDERRSFLGRTGFGLATDDVVAVLLVTSTDGPVTARSEESSSVFRSLETTGERP